MGAPLFFLAATGCWLGLAGPLAASAAGAVGAVPDGPTGEADF